MGRIMGVVWEGFHTWVCTCPPWCPHKAQTLHSRACSRLSFHPPRAPPSRRVHASGRFRLHGGRPPSAEKSWGSEDFLGT